MRFSGLSSYSDFYIGSVYSQNMVHALLKLLSQYLNFLISEENQSNQQRYEQIQKINLTDLHQDLRLTLPFCYYAREQGLAAFLFEVLKRMDRPPCVAWTFLQDQWLEQASAALARSRLLSKYWPKDLPSPMLIKGADLELSLYEPLGFPTGIRSCSDWDLLIPEPYYSKVIKDWESRFGVGIVPQSARFKNESPHELGFYIEGFLFEVHRDPAPLNFSSITGEQIWENRQSKVDAWGRKYYVPSAQDRLTIFLLNYGKSGGQTRLLNWLDLVMIIRALSPAEQSELFRVQAQVNLLNQPQISKILKDVLVILNSTPLMDTIHKQNVDLVEQQPVNLNLLFASLYRYQEQTKKSVLQVHYCESALRAQYIQAKILKLVE